MNLTHEDVQNILRIIDSPCTELHLETGDFKLFVRKVNDPERGAPRGPEPTPAAAPPTSTSRPWMPASAPPLAPASSPAEHPAALPVSRRPLAADEHAITAPMLGTFYRAPSPGAPPFVEVGDIVEPDTIICIVEVMKLMNSIRAERRGRVVEILVENAQLVERGERLIILGPAP